MKNIPVTLVVCMLLFSSLDVLAQQPQGGTQPKECCFKYYPKRLMVDSVETFQRDLRCPRAGVVFTMKNGAKVCVDPAQPWVQDVMKSKASNS